MNFQEIERREGLTREEFQNHYLKHKIPVIFTDLSANWEATNKWTFDWLKENHGHIEVPLFGADVHQSGEGYMSPKQHMKFGDYLDLIQEKPTELRMFLFNIFKHVPELANDFTMPTIMDGWISSHPYMFFGGEGSKVSLHYDIDCSNVFITQFQNKKKEILLFDQDQSPLLYRHPFTVQSHVDVKNPDYNEFPAARNVEGYRCTISNGETLFIPSLYWHYITYTEGGYSLSLRANDSIKTKVKGLWNICRHFVIDKGLNAILGDRWKAYKVNYAKNRAEANGAKLRKVEQSL